MKLWIKLLRDYAGYKAGAVVEEDEAIARAYITAQVAEEHQAAGDTLAGLRTTLDREVADLRAAAAEFQREQLRALGAVKDALRPAPRHDSGAIVAVASEDDKFLRSGGFHSLGHFGRAIIGGLHREAPNPALRGMLDRYNETANRVAAHLNQQLRALGSPDGMFENSDPDGGLLVPADFGNRIWERVYEQADLLRRTDNYTVTGNSLMLPANAETSRADGSRWGGVLGYWEGEAQQFTGSRPKFRNLQLRLKKLTVLTYVTNELLTDNGMALDQYLQRASSNEIAFKILDALVNGTGAGIPRGILKDPALVTVAKETNQAAQTVVYNNILKMYNAMWAPCRANSVWLYNQEIEPQLWQMALPVGTGGLPVYLPPGTVGSSGANAPVATLYGRPMLPLEQCPGIGTPGDILLVCPDQILSIVKGGIQSSMSIHLKFDFDESVFKWIFRMDAQGAWSAPLVPYKTNKSMTYSFAVALAQR